jgi:hypothetical protein
MFSSVSERAHPGGCDGLIILGPPGHGRLLASLNFLWPAVNSIEFDTGGTDDLLRFRRLVDDELVERR